MNPFTERYTQMTAAKRRDALHRSPMLRQETVARHYLQLAKLAADLDGLIQLRRHSETQAADYSRAPAPDVDALIDQLEAAIVGQHVLDFGVQPAWVAQPVVAQEERP